MKPASNQVNRQQRTWIHFLVLCALALRVVYTPLHLVQEEHLGVGGLHLAHAAENHDHAQDDHEHDGDHLPHPALDHSPDLIVQRSSSEERIQIPHALPPCESLSLKARLQSALGHLPEPEAPKLNSRPAPLTRGPPTTA